MPASRASTALPPASSVLPLTCAPRSIGSAPQPDISSAPQPDPLVINSAPQPDPLGALDLARPSEMPSSEMPSSEMPTSRGDRHYPDPSVPLSLSARDELSSRAESAASQPLSYSMQVSTEREAAARRTRTAEDQLADGTPTLTLTSHLSPLTRTRTQDGLLRSGQPLSAALSSRRRARPSRGAPAGTLTGHAHTRALLGGEAAYVGGVLSVRNADAPPQHEAGLPFGWISQQERQMYEYGWKYVPSPPPPRPTLLTTPVAPPSASPSS